jgi:hypothetical protein
MHIGLSVKVVLRNVVLYDTLYSSTHPRSHSKNEVHMEHAGGSTKEARAEGTLVASQLRNTQLDSRHSVRQYRHIEQFQHDTSNSGKCKGHSMCFYLLNAQLQMPAGTPEAKTIAHSSSCTVPHAEIDPYTARPLQPCTP